MLFLYVKCRNWRDSHWDFPAVLSQRFAATLQVHPRASSTVISSSLWSCITSSLSPCPPPDPGIFLISDAPHLTPPFLVSQCLLQKLDKLTGLSGDAGREPGVISVCRLSKGCSQEMYLGAAQAIPSWRQVEAGPVSSSGPAVCGYGGKRRTLKTVVEAPWRQKEVPEIEKCGRKVIFLVCIWGLWISFLCKEGLPGILWPVLYPEGNSLALDSVHTWDFTLQWGRPVTNHLQNVISKVFLRCRLCDCFHIGLLLAHSSAGLSKLHNI